MTTFEPGARLAFTQGLVFKPFSTAFLASRPAATITDGFDVLVQLVIAAITTEPLVIDAGGTSAAASSVLGGADRRSAAFGGESLDRPATMPRARFLAGRRRLQLFEGGLKRRLRIVQRHPVLRTPGPGQARLDGREVQLQRVGILGLRRVGRVEHPLRLGVSLDQRDQAPPAGR